MPVPLSGCSSGLAVATALVALALLPVQYYVPELYSSSEDSPRTADRPRVPLKTNWFDVSFSSFPPLDLIFAAILFMLAFVTYVCEWIQRKLMERRIIKAILSLYLYFVRHPRADFDWFNSTLPGDKRPLKLNQYLRTSVERLRAWDARQEQLESALRAVQGATAEYNLLLYLLLRQPGCLARPHAPPHAPPPPNYLPDKERDDDFAFLRNPTLDVQLL